jgi:hypothetical protein
VIGTYAAVVAVCGASLAIGQAAIALCGVRAWSWLSPAVGLALLCALCWGTVRLPAGGTTSAVVVLALAVAAVLYLRGRVEGAGEALRAGAPVALAALAAVSLPFAIEGHFGILGTGFNPDMSQHLLAGDRLAHDAGSQLLRDGYPLGPHAIVVALKEGLGIGLVDGFSGLTMAVAVLASLTALAALGAVAPLRRTAAALLVGLPYLVASYLAQGAFKETIQALLILAFVLALREASGGWRAMPLRFVPAALLAVGSVYAYSFPGLLWMGLTAVLWVAVELAVGRGPGAGVVRAALLATAVLLVGALPELGRMVDFGGFETFDPNGPGLGNLFGQISPFEALGIWPSGDFRVAPGDGAAPALIFYLGAAFAAALLVHGLLWCWRRRETALVAGVLAGGATYAATRIGGTPYTAAKALEVAAPLATLAILVPLLSVRSPGVDDSGPARRFRGTALAAAYLVAAGGCSLLALANAPVGPASYSPALAELRPLLGAGSTLVLAPAELLDERHGARYIAWELRGDRVCIESETAAGGKPPPGIRFVLAPLPEGAAAELGEGLWSADTWIASAPYRGLRARRAVIPYMLWERVGPVRGRSGCPLIAVRQARQGRG